MATTTAAGRLDTIAAQPSPDYDLAAARPEQRVKRKKLFISTLDASIVLTSAGSSITVQATQIKPGFFNEHVTMGINHADAVRMYVWLGKVVGEVSEGTSEAQP